MLQYFHFQRDLPIAILGSLLICAMLYIAVCLVLTGMVPYMSLGDEAPLAEAFTAKGMKFISLLISIGAVAGLTTTLLVGLYVQVCSCPSTNFYSMVNSSTILKTSIYFSPVCILGWEEMAYFRIFSPKYITLATLLSTLKYGLVWLLE